MTETVVLGPDSGWTFCFIIWIQTFIFKWNVRDHKIKLR